MNTNSNPTPTQNNAYSQVPSPAKPVNSQPGDSLTQTQRAALHALIEARLDGLRGKGATAAAMNCFMNCRKPWAWMISRA